MVSCLTLATFWTHPSSSHRIRLGCLNLFILIFMLAEARTRLPMAGSQLPLVGKSGYDLSRRDLIHSTSWSSKQGALFINVWLYSDRKKITHFYQDLSQFHVPHSGPENLKKSSPKNSWNQINQFHGKKMNICHKS